MSTTALRAAATGQVQGKPKTILDFLQDKRVADGLTAVAGRLLQPDRLLRLCINAVKKTPKLLECDPQTVLGAMMASAALGLEPNTVQQQAFLIPYKRRAKVGRDWVDVYDCQFQIGARGFITLGYRSPELSKWNARAIHDGDHWKEMDGSRTLLEHSVALKNRGELIGAYSHVLLSSGAELACVLPLDELEKIRSKSETFRSLQYRIANAENDKDRQKAEQALAETPWVMWMDDMAAKSAIKKHAKQLPIAAGEALASAAELDTQSDAGALDLRALTDPDLVRAVVADEEEPPALENKPSEQLEGMSGEAFGATQRQAETVQAAKAERIQRATRAPKQQGQQQADRGESPPVDANAFIARLDDADSVQACDAILAEAKNAGLSADQFQLVLEAHRMATAAGGD